MLYTVLITASPELSFLHEKALAHCRKLIENGNLIKQVFFMHAATQTAVHFDARQWSQFAAQYQIELQTCITTAEQQKLDFQDYMSGFLQGGLSSLADSILSSDAILQINDDVVQADITPIHDKKNIIFVFRNPPEEASYAAEGVDLLLVLSAFDANVRVVFVGEGIQNLYDKGSHPRYVKRFKALSDFDVSECFIVAENEQAFLGASEESSVSCGWLTQSDFNQLTMQPHTLYF